MRLHKSKHIFIRRVALHLRGFYCKATATSMTYSYNVMIDTSNCRMDPRPPAHARISARMRHLAHTHHKQVPIPSAHVIINARMCHQARTHTYKHTHTRTKQTIDHLRVRLESTHACANMRTHYPKQNPGNPRTRENRPEQNPDQQRTPSNTPNNGNGNHLLRVEAQPRPTTHVQNTSILRRTGSKHGQG